MVAPVFTAVEEYSAAAPQPTIAGDSMKQFFGAILMRIFR